MINTITLKIRVSFSFKDNIIFMMFLHFPILIKYILQDGLLYYCVYLRLFGCVKNKRNNQEIKRTEISQNFILLFAFPILKIENIYIFLTDKR